MAAEDIGAIYNTKIPGYDDAADIQAALKLFLYGSTTYDVNNTDKEQLPNPSLARHLKNIQDDISLIDELGTGSVLSATEPEASDLPLNGEIPNGFIWVDSSQSATGTTGYLAAVYSNEAPTTNLVDGLIWIDKNATPIRAFVYNESTLSWDVFNQLENLIDAPGDLIYGSSDNTYARLPIGSNHQILRVGNGLPYWDNEKRWLRTASGSLSGSALNISSVNAERVAIVLKDWSHNSGVNAVLSMQFNNDTGFNYVDISNGVYSISLESSVVGASASNNHVIFLDLVNTTAIVKPVYTLSQLPEFGYYMSTSPISSIQMFLSAGNFDAGQYEIWSYR